MNAFISGKDLLTRLRAGERPLLSVTFPVTPAPPGMLLRAVGLEEQADGSALVHLDFDEFRKENVAVVDRGLRTPEGLPTRVWHESAAYNGGRATLRVGPTDKHVGLRLLNETLFNLYRTSGFAGHYLAWLKERYKEEMSHFGPEEAAQLQAALDRHKANRKDAV